MIARSTRPPTTNVSRIAASTLSSGSRAVLSLSQPSATS
jgi:hypothetical protein